MGGEKGLALLLNVSSILQYTWISRSYASARFHSIMCNSFSSTVDVTGQLTVSPTCPGHTFNFNCTVTGDMSGVTTWRLNGSIECNLLLRSDSISTCNGSDNFRAMPGAGFGTTATSFTSTLSGTAYPALNGTLIECFGPANNVDLGNRVGNRTIQIVGECDFAH